jgi:hypothetical protein
VFVDDFPAMRGQQGHAHCLHEGDSLRFRIDGLLRLGVWRLDERHRLCQFSEMALLLGACFCRRHYERVRRVVIELVSDHTMVIVASRSLCKASGKPPASRAAIKAAERRIRLGQPLPNIDGTSDLIVAQLQRGG